MEVTSEEIQRRIQELSDDELLAMVNDYPSQYVPEVLSFAADEVAKRGLTGASFVTGALIQPTKAGAKAVAEALRPSIYGAAGEKVVCPHCGNERFSEQAVLLNTQCFTFFRLDWLNRNATALICSKCGLIQWFAKSLEREFSTESQEE